MTQRIGNSGRLVVNASVFKNHIDGIQDQHEGAAITLDPLVNINGTDAENVRQAIELLSDYLTEINVDADGATKGFIQLSNDLGGTATSPNVVQITGDGTNEIIFTPRNVVFNNTGSTDVEFKFSGTGTTARSIKITAQSATNVFGGNGGDVVLQTGGRNTFSGTLIGKLNINLNTANIFTAKELSTTTKIISLFGDATTSNVPGAANDSLFIFDTASDPVSNPVGGSHLYSRSGKVKVKNANGDTFNIGDTPTEWINGSSAAGTINRIKQLSVAPSSPDKLDEFTTSNASIILVSARIVAIAGTGNSACFILNASFETDGLSMTQIGTTEVQYQEVSSIITVPTITPVSNTIKITSGYDSVDVTVWLGDIKYTIYEV